MELTTEEISVACGISLNRLKQIEPMISNERLVVPGMDNKVLLLYMPNVKEIILLDEACDQPRHANWDSKVSCGEIPLLQVESAIDKGCCFMYNRFI